MAAYFSAIRGLTNTHILFILSIFFFFPLYVQFGKKEKEKGAVPTHVESHKHTFSSDQGQHFPI